MRGGFRSIAVSGVLAVLAVVPGVARAERPAAPPAAPRAFTFSLELGPTFGWYGGGHLGFGFGGRLTELISLVVSPRVAGGMGWDDNPFAEAGGDVGLHFRAPRPSSGVGHVALGVNYLMEIEGPRTNYRYVAPHLRLGGGFRKGSPTKRFAWGVDGRLRVGYGFDVSDHASEFSDADYGGTYGAFEVALVFER